ncbi:hypothetical protein CPB97_009327 [Podila verticillata]|nr:hypothetical protein CPB97_009327 [Podila verticillata]
MPQGDMARNVSFLSKRDDGLIVAGCIGNDDYPKLEFCAVTTDTECTAISAISASVYQNVNYRFRIKGHAKEYVRFDGPSFKTVESFVDVSGFQDLEVRLGSPHWSAGSSPGRDGHNARLSRDTGTAKDERWQSAVRDQGLKWSS